MSARKGLHRSDLNWEFFSAVARGMGVDLITWKEEEMPNTGGVASALEKEASANTALKGLFKFNILGKYGDGAERWQPVVVKSKGTSKDCTDSWSVIYKSQGEEIYSLAKQFHGLVMGNTHAVELMVQAARLVSKDAFFARYRPKVYHTILDADAEISVVVMDYIPSECAIIGGGVEYKDWTRELRYTALKEIACFHAHYMNKDNMAKVVEQFQGILEQHPQRHLQTLPFIREALKVHEVKDSQYTAERCNILWAYVDQLEEITKEVESYPMTFVHNDFHNGRCILFKRVLEKCC